MFSWLRKKGAPIVDLDAQLRAAQAAVAAAESAVQAAQLDFDESGTDAASKALARARDAATVAHEHLGRAQRLHDAKRAELAALQRTDDEQRRTELRAELTHDRVSARLEPTAQRECELILELVRLRFARQHEARELDRLAHDLRRLERTLDPGFARRESEMWVDELGRTRCPIGINPHASVCTAGERTIAVIGSSTASAEQRSYAVMLARALFGVPAPRVEG